MSLLKNIDRIIIKLARLTKPKVDWWANKPYINFPLGDKPWADSETYRNIWTEAQKKEYPLINRYEKEAGFSIDQDWFHRLALTTQIVIKKSEICYQHGRLLYSALSRYIAQTNATSVNILETGTARGFSSLCMAKALSDGMKPGKILTFDLLPNNVKMFWNCIADTDGPQTRSELLRDYAKLAEDYIVFHQGDSRVELTKVDIARVHFAFLDGMHNYRPLMKEFEYLKSRQKKGDIIFFDDYTPLLFPEIVQAVDEICHHYNYTKNTVTMSEQRGYVIAVKNE